MSDDTRPGRRAVVTGAAVLALSALLPPDLWAATLSAAPDGTLYVIAELVAAPGHEETLRGALTTAARAAPGEPGCVSYHLLEDNERLGRFLTVETWASEAALTAHLTSPAMKKAGPMLATILARPFALTRLHRLV